MLVYPGSYRTIPPLLSATRKAGIKSTIIGSDGWDHEKLYAIDANTLGSQYYFSYFHISDPQDSVQNFVNEYETNFGTKPDSLAALGYDSIRAAIQALVLSKTGKPTQLLNSLEGARFPGIYGAGHFSKDHVYLRPYPFIITTGGQPHFMARLMPESN
ncbi:MAG: ABC transporter substrate-binding protein [Proteobacteria bacterium]|nr:ABC transporter substrate-binding protein [Pseudomonadota bacterium]